MRQSVNDVLPVCSPGANKGSGAFSRCGSRRSNTGQTKKKNVLGCTVHAFVWGVAGAALRPPSGKFPSP